MGCRDLTIRGLSIDYDPVLNTQGVVENVDASGGTMTLKVDDGYPCGSEYGHQIQIFDPATRLLKKDVPQINGATTEVLPDRQLRIQTSLHAAALKVIAPGDLIALDRKAEGPSHAIQINDSAHVVLEDVAVHGSSGFGVFESGGEGGNEYRRLRITPGLKPLGASTERLRSAGE